MRTAYDTDGQLHQRAGSSDDDRRGPHETKLVSANAALYDGRFGISMEADKINDWLLASQMLLMQITDCMHGTGCRVMGCRLSVLLLLLIAVSAMYKCVVCSWPASFQVEEQKVLDSGTQMMLRA